MNLRHEPAERKALLLTAALTEARRVGYQQVTRESLAAQAACSPALISAYFGTMHKMRRAIISAAIARSDLAVLAQGLAARDAKARTARPELQRAAMESMLS